MAQRNSRRRFLSVLLWILLGVFVYQNCGGFKELPVEESLSSLENPSSSPTPNPDQVGTTYSRSLSASEMQPIEVLLPANKNFTPRNMPSGAVYDASLKKFLWIARKGQAGNYTVNFDGATGQNSYILNLKVTSIPESTLSQGPFDGVQDGDVGYVFIHGMGSVDRCGAQSDLAAYWLGSQQILSRRPDAVTTTCYNSASRVEEVAPSVAQQILNANCGRFQKCILITHSMGGLVAEFIMNHTRAAVGSDPEPALFAQAALYQKVKEKTLAVVSIASAAGGSRVASILEDPSQHPTAQQIVGYIAERLYQNSGASKSVTVQRATTVLSPLNADPGVPFYMVPGFTMQTAAEAWLSFWQLDIPMSVFNGDGELTGLDTVTNFASRSDGLVDFRSSCGILDGNEKGGPGAGSSLAVNLGYCATATKKPNHYVWFLSNTNHYLIAQPWGGCSNGDSPCETYDPVGASFAKNSNYHMQPAIQVMRIKMDQGRSRLGLQQLIF